MASSESDASGRSAVDRLLHRRPAVERAPGRLERLPRPANRPGEAQHRLGRAARVLEQPADRVVVEAVSLQLAHELEAGDVLGPVEAGPPPDLGRRQKPAGLVREDVADREPGPAGELVDREGLVGDLRPPGGR